MADTHSPDPDDTSPGDEQEPVVDAVEELLDPDEPNPSPATDSEAPPPG